MAGVCSSSSTGWALLERRLPGPRVLITVPASIFPAASPTTIARCAVISTRTRCTSRSAPAQASGRLGALPRFIADNWRFHRLLANGAFELVHVNPSMNMRCIVRDGVLLLIARAHRVPVLVFFRGWDPAYAARIRECHRRLFGAVYGKAAAMVVLAREFQATLAGLRLALPTWFETTLVDEALLALAPGERAPRPAGACEILYLGRLDRGKGLIEALEAFALVRREWPGATLSIAGDGPERAAGVELVAARGIGGVRFLGHVEDADKARAFRDADIYLFTSLAEGMPNSVLEAMAFGLPVVTSAVGGLRDFFEDGRMGSLVIEASAGEYARRLLRLARDPGLRRVMGDYNRDFASRRFFSPVVAGRLLEIYDQVAKQAAAR